jgi:hypothetical protein
MEGERVMDMRLDSHIKYLDGTHKITVTIRDKTHTYSVLPHVAVDFEHWFYRKQKGRALNILKKGDMKP